MAHAAQKRGNCFRDGIEQFPFGQHQGKPFWRVAREDPGYHFRIKENESEAERKVLDRYIEWFNLYGPQAQPFS